MIYRNLISGRSYSALPVSGERLMQILGRSLAYAGDAAILDAEAGRRRLLEETAQSLDDASRNQQGLNAGVEGIMEYENEFVPE
jgi:hypothetical protein